MTRPQPLVVLRLAAGAVLAVVLAIVVAREWMAGERAGWESDGDPDGESIVQVFGFLVGAGVLLASAIALAGLELVLWLRRRRARRAAAEQQRLEAIGSAPVQPD